MLLFLTAREHTHLFMRRYTVVWAEGSPRVRRSATAASTRAISSAGKSSTSPGSRRASSSNCSILQPVQSGLAGCTPKALLCAMQLSYARRMHNWTLQLGSHLSDLASALTQTGSMHAQDTVKQRTADDTSTQS